LGASSKIEPSTSNGKNRYSGREGNRITWEHIGPKEFAKKAYVTGKRAGIRKTQSRSDHGKNVIFDPTGPKLGEKKRGFLE